MCIHCQGGGRQSAGGLLRSALAGFLILGVAGVDALAYAELGVSEFGSRVGASDGKNGADFTLYEIFARKPLYWSWNERWRLETYLEAGLGWLKAGRDEGLFASIGPVAVFGRSDSRWRIELGVKPTWLSEDRYGRVDMGGHLHFSSHLGLHYRFRSGLQFGYRFQHTSNADLDTPNPGLDVHLVTVSWVL